MRLGGVLDVAAVAAGELGSVRAMTAPERMTPEREAALRHRHRKLTVICNHCGQTWPCALIEVLDALAAERAHAQQVEVPLSSAAGFAVLARDDQGVALILDQSGHDDQLFVSVNAAEDEVKAWNDDPQLTVVAVVPVSVWPGTDGRIGS